jgi:hypothetical protein
VTFEGRFDLELSTGCTADSLTVQGWREAGNSWANIGSPLCGRQLPEAISTPTGWARIVFSSNRDTNGDGFTLRWKAGCGGHFVSSSGSLVSPGYPAGRYSNNLNCTWTITPPGSHFTVATFPGVFDLETGTSCRHDRVEVLETRSNRSGVLAGRYCGTRTPVPVATRGPMTVRLVTDSSITRSVNQCIQI